VCYYARKYAATLLTGDRQLRRYAEANNVSVRGILFIFDELVANNVISSQQASAKLRELVAINVRLPKSEIEKRINNWGLL
ncbi:MAG: type II toxin-antitoxin system VapC family toxin, partial [Muribaculaceae bacterium]|nr:type II toxin-antitoxin system VapC family toxin [Muribaculaceae bacterium]